MPDCSTGTLSLAPSVVDLLIADADDFVGRRVPSLMLTLGGLQGDRHEGETRKSCARTPWHSRGTRIANTRQLSLVSIEECEEIAEALGIEAVDPALLGPNLVLAGIAGLSLIPPATRLQFPSGATLFITEQNVPCRHPGARIAAAHDTPRLAAAFGRAATGRRGLLALVEREGPIHAGDPVRRIDTRTARPHLPRVTA
ncbi:MAG: MOSC domain-containing protein [Janthinobacterium lividum]